ncbi:MAG: sulfatase/phosphatase domain-containing protein, partial [Planctomycetota bacterium]
GGHRVPCFIRWPAGGIGGGADIKRVTAHIDMLPTLIELCGLEKPEGVKLDGASLAPLLKGDDKNWPDRVLITDSQRVEFPIKWRKSSVMTDRWRLVNGKELYDTISDPGQRKDIADERPDVVARLRKVYEDWWTDISGRFLEKCEIIIGSDNENPSMLTSHDWHTHGPWNQIQVREGPENNSYWAVEVARDGEYEISLRRWPQEVDAPITAAIDDGRAISATTARLRMAGVDQTKPLPKDAAAVTFTVKLKAGKTRLQTWFNNDDGKSRGAYYVYVKRLD